MTSGGKAPLSRWFLAGVVSVLARSVKYSSSGWVKSAVGWAIVSICSQMWSSGSGVLDDLMGKFLGNLTYSESPSLSPELATNVTSPSGLVVNMVVLNGPSIGHARFKFILWLLMSACVVVSEEVVLVSVWSA